MSDKLRVLAIETATPACSAALRIDGEVQQQIEVGNNIHSQRVLQMVAELLQSAGLAAADLDAVAVGRGPGSFTGLRIGVGVAQGIAYGAVCPMIGVSSLRAMVARLEDCAPVVAGIDARMGQIYWARYDKSSTAILVHGETQVSAPAAVDYVAGQVLVGNAWEEYRDQLGADFWENSELRSDINFPRAAEILTLAEIKYANKELIDPARFAPHYVRDNVANKPQ